MKMRSAAVCLLAAGVLAGAAGCGQKGNGERSMEVAPVVTGVTLLYVAATAIPEQIEAVGTVRARNSSLLAARIPGTVVALHVKEGDRVAKGKLLVTLEANEVTAGAAGAQAGVEEARRGVEDAQARKKLADVTFERYQKLFQEQAVTKQEFDQRQMEREVAAQGLARAEARLSQAREGAKSAGTMAGYGRITAPISGIVTGKQIDVGMTVFPGMPLLTVEEEGKYRLEVAAPESLLGKVKPGGAVQVAMDGIGGETSGRVAEVVPTVDPASRTFTVKVDVAAKGLRSGIYGRVLFPVGVRTALFVPKRAVVERGALTSLWVVDKEHIARMRLVKTGAEVRGGVEVLAGLSPGERVVVGGMERVVEGARIP